MAIGLAVRQISKYTALIEGLAPQIQEAESELLRAVNDRNQDDIANIQARLTRMKTLIGFAKDFLEFWKEMIKSVMAMLKSFNELARGAQ